MQIIPAINCQNFECVKDKLQKTAEFSNWIQIDIADGKFTAHKTWNNSVELFELRIKNQELRKLNIEVHLMVENPLAVIDDWIKAGVKRIIVHWEALENSKFKNQNAKLQFKNQNYEIGLAINPDTSVKKLIAYFLNYPITFIQILAVNPGLAGQKFQPQVLEKIKFLKKNYPDVIIEVDGGINLETAKLCKEAGADILVSGSYIWDNEDNLKVFKELSDI